MLKRMKRNKLNKLLLYTQQKIKDSYIKLLKNQVLI